MQYAQTQQDELSEIKQLFHLSIKESIRKRLTEHKAERMVKKRVLELECQDPVAQAVVRGVESTYFNQSFSFSW